MPAEDLSPEQTNFYVHQVTKRTAVRLGLKEDPDFLDRQELRRFISQTNPEVFLLLNEFIASYLEWASVARNLPDIPNSSNAEYWAYVTAKDSARNRLLAKLDEARPST